MSLPTRGAWIEMEPVQNFVDKALSLPTRGAWIEIVNDLRLAVVTQSLPTRGAWIEIVMVAVKVLWTMVAPHTGSVD